MTKTAQFTELQTLRAEVNEAVLAVAKLRSGAITQDEQWGTLEKLMNHIEIVLAERDELKTALKINSESFGKLLRDHTAAIKELSLTRGFNEDGEIG